MKPARKPHTKRIPPRTASPTMKAMFNLMTEGGFRLEDIARRIEKHPNRLSEYRTGKVEPGVMTVEEMAAEIGYRLELVPIKTKGGQTKPPTG